MASTQQDLLQRLERFSSWGIARCAVAVCIRLKNILKERVSGDRSRYVQDRTYVPIDTAEIEAAEKVILRAVQTQAFPHEVKVLQRLSKADFTD